MKIDVICEGATEAAIKQGLREFVQARAAGDKRVGITTRALDGPTIRRKLDRVARRLLDETDIIGVVALSDVYPHYKNAKETKDALRTHAGSTSENPNFRAHAAQFEVEAWILPFWNEIAKQLNVSAASPGANPEQVNGQKPPSHHIKELFRRAKREYDKILDGPRWLTADCIRRSADACPELKSFLNSLLDLAGAATLP